MTSRPDCLSNSTFAGLLDHRLPADRRAEVEVHVDACASCRQLLIELSATVSSSSAAAELHTTYPASPSMDVSALARGSVVGRFVVLDLLGVGGMGIVYTAYDPELDRKVALKLLRPDSRAPDDARGHLLAEAQTMAQISHANVIAIYEVGTVREHVFAAMELVEGVTLRTWMAERSRNWQVIVDVFLLAGEGLAAAHTAGVVHRDFKPENVLLGGDGRVKVSDFGLANPLSARRDHVAGTPGYLPPEAFQPGGVDHRSDQFSFCVALHEALYGNRPFSARTLDDLIAQVQRGPSLHGGARSAPARLNHVIARGLAAAPDGRYPSMRALLTEIHEVVAARRRRRFVATALASLAVVAGGTALAVTAGSDAHSPPCSDASEQLAEIWDGARRSALESALLRVPGGDAAFPRVASVIDRYAAEWAAIRSDACEATAVRGTQPPRVRDLRMACLDRARIQLRELVDQLMEPHFDITRLAVAAAEALPALDACSDADALRAIVSPPIGPMARSQLPTQVHAGTTESASREPASGDEPAATHRPEFRLPFGCGETWQLTYPPGHDPAGRQIDFTLPGDAPATGLAVFASAPGWVSAVVPGNGEVDLNHGDGWFTTYQHMTNVSVTLHQYVGRGHVLGKVGNTGVKNALGGPGTAHLRYAQLHQPGVISADFDHDPGRAMVDPSFDNEVFDRGARRAQSRTSTNNCPGGGTPAGAAQYDMPVSSSVFSRTESTMEIATHRSDDHALYERWYHDGWDGAPLPHTIAGRPAVVVYRGDLHIFVRKSDGTILDLRYDPFSGWATTYLDGKMAGDPDAVVYGWDQRLVVAARGEDGWLYQWWTVNGSWSHKVRVGNIAAVGTPALFSHYDTLYIVARTPDGAMRSWETDRRRTWTERHLAGVASDDPDIGVDPRSGRVNVVARGTDDRLYRWQAGEAHGAGGWSTPELIDADLVIAGAPATTIYHGAMRIIARDRNGAVHHWWKDTTWHREDTLGAYSSDPTVVQYGEQLQTVGRGIDGILHTTWYEPTGRMWQVETQDVPVAD